MIYFIQNTVDNLIKIGYAASPKKRLKQLQLKGSGQLVLLLTLDGSYNKERELHKKFANLRIKGEWFSPGEDLISFISNSTPFDESQKPHFYLPSSAEQTIKNLGAQLKLARRRRRWTISDLSKKVGVSVPTVIAIEQGKSQVSVGVVFSTMWVLGLDDLMTTISHPEDKVGHALMDSRLPKRIRHKKPNNNF